MGKYKMTDRRSGYNMKNDSLYLAEVRENSDMLATWPARCKAFPTLFSNIILTNLPTDPPGPSPHYHQ